MNTIIKNSARSLSLIVAFLLSSFLCFSTSHVTMSLKNITTTANTIEYDLFVVNDGNTSIRMSGCSFGVNFDESIVNGGTLSYSFKANSRNEVFDISRKLATEALTDQGALQARMTTAFTTFDKSNELLPNKPFKLGRFTISNSRTWTVNSNPKFSMQEVICKGKTTTALLAFENGYPQVISLLPMTEAVQILVEQSPVLNPLQGIEKGANSGNQMNKGSHLIAAENNVNIYPNPANASLHVDYFASENTTINLRIVDMQGRVVLQREATILAGANLVTFDIESFVKGLYVIQIMDKGHAAINQTFTKQ